MCLLSAPTVGYRSAPTAPRTLAAADAVLPSLDAGSEGLYRAINRPYPGLTLPRHVEGLVAFRKSFSRRLWVEVMLVAVLNDSERALRDLAAILRRIEEEHPFEAPENGVVGEERAEAFMAVTDDAWDEIGTWTEDLEALRESASSPEGGAVQQLGELASGARAIGGCCRVGPDGVRALRRTLAGPTGAHLAGTAAVAGHCYPVWNDFDGGKGVATAAGCFAVISFTALAIAILIFAGAVALSRKVSAGSLSAAAVLPLGVMWAEQSIVLTGCAAIGIRLLDEAGNEVPEGEPGIVQP